MKKIKALRDKIESNIIFKIVRVVAYVVAILLVAVILLQKFTKINLGGFSIYRVDTGSMVGEYAVGDIVVSKKMEAKDINIGDNVSYVGRNFNLDVIITHKVIDKYTEDGQIYYVTKGLVNDAADPKIKYEDIVGKVVYKTIILSFFGRLMSNTVTYFLVFMVVGVIVSIEIVSSMFDSDEEEEEDDRRE